MKKISSDGYISNNKSEKSQNRRLRRKFYNISLKNVSYIQFPSSDDVSYSNTSSIKELISSSSSLSNEILKNDIPNKDFLKGLDNITTNVWYNDQEETLYEHYLEWLYYLLDSMYGAPHSQTYRPNSPLRLLQQEPLCSSNLDFQNRGCAMLIPTCVNFTEVRQTTRWTCSMRLWSGCSCSYPYPWFFKYMVPRYKECYSELLHPADIASLLKLDSPFETTREHRILIPTGKCQISGFFLLYIAVVIFFILILTGFIKNIISRLHDRIFRKKTFIGPILTSDKHRSPLLVHLGKDSLSSASKKKL